MGREIEVKLKLAEPEFLRARLQTAGATPAPCVFELNHIFDAADGSLRRRGCALRVREVREGGVWTNATLTYKGPREGGEFKAREELETLVDDAPALIALLDRLGFVETIDYEKRRETWTCGACEIVIDELPQLGWFAEIEGPSDEAVRACRSLLGLDGFALTAESYVELAARYGITRHGIAGLRFD